MSIPMRTLHGPPSDASVFSSHHTVSGYRNALKWCPRFASGLLPELLQQKGSECFRGILGEHPNAQNQWVIVSRREKLLRETQAWIQVGAGVDKPETDIKM